MWQRDPRWIPRSGGVGHLTVSNTLVDKYQKNGIVIAGAGSTATISNTTVTGNGAITAIAQNGIVIIDGATATLTGNTVSGNDCDDPGCGPDPTLGDQSAGILAFQRRLVTMSGNTVTGNDIGILVFNTAGIVPLRPVTTHSPATATRIFLWNPQR